MDSKYCRETGERRLVVKFPIKNAWTEAELKVQGESIYDTLKGKYVDG